MMARLRSPQAGFTFVELLVVITIIGVIFASAAVAFGVVTVRSRDAKRKSDLELIRQALEMCRSITGLYPLAEQVTTTVQCGANGPITLKSVPVDPKPGGLCGETYVYTVEDDLLSYELSSCSESTDEGYSVSSP